MSHGATCVPWTHECLMEPRMCHRSTYVPWSHMCPTESNVSHGAMNVPWNHMCPTEPPEFHGAMDVLWYHLWTMEPWIPPWGHQCHMALWMSHVSLRTCPMDLSIPHRPRVSRRAIRVPCVPHDADPTDVSPLWGSASGSLPSSSHFWLLPQSCAGCPIGDHISWAVPSAGRAARLLVIAQPDPQQPGCFATRLNRLQVPAMGGGALPTLPLKPHSCNTSGDTGDTVDTPRPVLWSSGSRGSRDVTV